MVYMGIAVMVYNVYGFVQYARYIKSQKTWRTGSGILNIPIVLVVLFLIGYIAVALFGEPDTIIASILFGGSLFVLFMHKYLNSITQRILENERLETELRAAEKSNEAKTAFLAGMSHEMHTPLNVILGMHALALKNPDLPSEARDQLEKANLSARHLLGLIDNALDLNRVETGILTVENAEFSLLEALEEVNAIAQARCEEKGLTYEPIAISLGVDRVVGDAMNLKRVLLSILDNAVKYTDAPGTVSFLVDCVKRDEEVPMMHFAVSDTGVGIDADFIPTVFEAFSQEDAGITSRYGGGGMSLAVAKNLVELMGGTIGVESKKGEGTTFTVDIPFECVDEPAVDDKPSESNPAEALDGARILIVEDIAENAEIVADLLELEGAESEHAENGQVAIDMMEQAPVGYYDAILMDLRMPIMDGLEATRRIRAMDRADAKTIPIIALTANAFEEDKRQSLEVGMNAHLAKPADSDLLYTTIGQFVRKTPAAEGGEPA